ncbi:hypothetical protein Tco_1070486 [Tanacetum coccineum]|uniref:Uncharacterized protein n=1 Tax=Tanacetum coccineum TaxID=301880 RepID=A0ABQ5HMW8_9ASTR
MPHSIELAPLDGFDSEDIILQSPNNEERNSLGGILGEVRVTTFRNAIRANYLSHSNDYVALPSIETIVLSYLEDSQQAEQVTKEKVVPYPMFLSMLLQHKMEGYGNDKVTLNLTQDFSALVCA